MSTRKASIKETGEELSPTDWERFDAAVAEVKEERREATSADSSEEGSHRPEGDGRTNTSGGSKM